MRLDWFWPCCCSGSAGRPSPCSCGWPASSRWRRLICRTSSWRRSGSPGCCGAVRIWSSRSCRCRSRHADVRVAAPGDPHCRGRLPRDRPRGRRYHRRQVARPPAAASPPAASRGQRPACDPGVSTRARGSRRVRWDRGRRPGLHRDGDPCVRLDPRVCRPQPHGRERPARRGRFGGADRRCRRRVHGPVAPAVVLPQNSSTGGHARAVRTAGGAAGGRNISARCWS